MIGSSETLSSGDTPTAVDPARLYGNWYYHSYAMPYEQENWAAVMAHIAHGVVTHVQPTTVLDVGCAKGFLVAALRNVGVDATGVDVSEVAVASAPDDVRSYVRVGSLTEPLDGWFDLITCIEVIEHLDPADCHRAVGHLCACTDAVLLSTTPNNQDEPTHVNVQPSERWAQLFAAQGFFRDLQHDASYVAPWAVLYRRSDKSVGDVVVDYERSLARLRATAIDQRTDLVAVRQTLAETQPPDRRAVDALHGEVDRLRQSSRSLEEKLGVVKGLMAEASATLAACAGSRERLDAIYRSRSWRLTRLVGSLLPRRALRRRTAG